MPHFTDDYRTVPTEPVTGKEPVLIHDLPLDNIVAAMLSLASDVYILRERVQTLEAELVAHRALTPNAVENHQPTPEERAAREADAKAFVERFWFNLTNSKVPRSTVTEKVHDYLKR
jgi:hypothetical protein